MNAHDTTPQTERLWTAIETARYLGVSKSWVYRHTASGDIPHGRFGALVRYNPACVRQYAEQMHAQASSPNVVSLASRRKGSR